LAPAEGLGFVGGSGEGHGDGAYGGGARTERCEGGKQGVRSGSTVRAVAALSVYPVPREIFRLLPLNSAAAQFGCLLFRVINSFFYLKYF
jgi:hypothetical protein